MYGAIPRNFIQSEVSIHATCNHPFYYIAGNYFSTARGLIVYFKDTWRLTMKLFPVKSSERATLQKIYDVRG